MDPGATITPDGTLFRDNASLAQSDGYREAVAEVRRIREEARGHECESTGEGE